MLGNIQGCNIEICVDCTKKPLVRAHVKDCWNDKSDSRNRPESRSGQPVVSRQSGAPSPLLSQPLGQIENGDPLVGVFRVAGAGRDHFGVGVLDGQQRRDLTRKGRAAGDIVADPDVHFLAAAQRDKVYSFGF